jgi:hypothetical protein
LFTELVRVGLTWELNRNRINVYGHVAVMRGHLWRAVFLQGRLFCPALSMQLVIFVLLILKTDGTR